MSCPGSLGCHLGLQGLPTGSRRLGPRLLGSVSGRSCCQGNGELGAWTPGFSLSLAALGVGQALVVRATGDLGLGLLGSPWLCQDQGRGRSGFGSSRPLWLSVGLSLSAGQWL